MHGHRREDERTLQQRCDLPRIGIVCRAHCYPQSTHTEREQYRRHQEALSLAVEDAWAQRKQLLRLAGSAVAADWLQRRDADRPWLNVLAEG